MQPERLPVEVKWTDLIFDPSSSGAPLAPCHDIRVVTRGQVAGSSGLAERLVLGGWLWNMLHRTDNMLHRTYALHLEGLGLAADDADTATVTFLRVYQCLEFLAAFRFDHLNGVERATLHAILAAVAFILRDVSHEPAL